MAIENTETLSWDEVKDTKWKIRRIEWPEGQYVCRDDKGAWRDEKGRINYHEFYCRENPPTGQWEYYPEESNPPMSFESALLLLKEGKKLTRLSNPTTKLYLNVDGFSQPLNLQEIQATDWILYNPPPPPLASLLGITYFNITQDQSENKDDHKYNLSQMLLLECSNEVQKYGLSNWQLLPFLNDFEKLIQYSKNSSSRVRAKCSFRFGELYTCDLFLKLMEGMTLKHKCYMNEYQVVQKPQEPLILNLPITL